jgi:signal transduction histidine kinase
MRSFFARGGPSVIEDEDLARSLAVITDPATLRSSIAERVRQLTGSDRAHICSLGPDKRMFVADPNGSPTTDPIAFAADSALVKWLRVNEAPFTIPHPSGALEYLGADERELLAKHGIRACVPMLSGSRLAAILVLASDQPRFRLSDRSLALLDRIGRGVGAVLENAQLWEQERLHLRNLHRTQQLAIIGQLAATVAHEVRNPLTAIRSTVQYVCDSAIDWTEKRKLLDGTLEAVDRIESTVGHLLAVGRPSELHPEPADLIRIVEDSLSLLQAYAQARQIHFERQFETPTLPIHGDVATLRQVCTNLVLNACQSMPDGGMTIVRASRAPSTDGERTLDAVVDVVDRGCGIPADVADKVFDPFFTTKSGGTGLGLALSLDVISRHGGTLRLSSIPQHGTTATIRLPLVPDGEHPGR